MKTRLALAVAAACICGTPVQSIEYASRIQDLVSVRGAQDNYVTGWGLVTGLANDGDKNGVATQQAYKNLLESHGLSVPAAQLNSKNIAIVSITAKIPPYAQVGSKISVSVGSSGDAKTLQGGELVQTILVGIDGEVYATAQGGLAVGGFSVGGGGGGGPTVTKNFPTVGTMVTAGIVTREIPVTMVRDNYMGLILDKSDPLTASRIAEKINAAYPNSSRMENEGIVKVRIPEEYRTQETEFWARVSQLEVVPNIRARVSINEKTGVLTTAGPVKMSATVILHGSFTVVVAPTATATPAAPLTPGQTVTTTNTTLNVNEGKGTGLVALPEMSTPEEIATLFNRLGVPPRDVMSIFVELARIGVLRAELEIH